MMYTVKCFFVDSVRIAVLATFTVLAGCGQGAPSVTSSTEEATVHGTIKYNGEPLTEGEVRFDPANVNRKSAPVASATIGKDGHYTVKTLVGPNAVNFNLPNLVQKEPQAAYWTLSFDAQKGDNTYEITLPPPAK